VDDGKYASRRQRLLAAIELHRQGRFAPAAAAYREVLAEEPHRFDALRLLGVALLESSQPADALTCLDRALAVRADMAEVWEQRGKALARLGRGDEACASFEQALALEPARVSTMNQLGMQLTRMEQFERALALFDRALAARPDLVEAWTNRGKVLSDLKRSKEAISSFDRALGLRPDLVAAWDGRVAPLRQLGRIDEALQSCDRALAIDPTDPLGWSLRATLMAESLRRDEALRCFDEAERLGHSDPSMHFNRGLLHLMSGQFEQGWEGYEWRLKVPGMGKPPLLQAPVWDGSQPLAARTLLLTCEQGLGDAIQFSRYAPWLAQHRSVQVCLLVPAALRSLMQTLPPAVQVVSEGDPIATFDYQCPLLSVPHRVKTTLGGIVADTPYLQADPDRVSAWRHRLGATRRQRIGVVCSGNPDHGNDAHRSIALARLAPLSRAGAELHLVQNDLRDEDLAALPALRIADHREELRDFADTAALIACLDLVISVDTSVAHLAGALSAPLWVLLSANPDWRWMLEREDSPWYPSARLFRQRRLGDWDAVIERVASELACAISPPLP
jgi:tetratricopeptide (TPR) repeat protein